MNAGLLGFALAVCAAAGVQQPDAQQVVFERGAPSQYSHAEGVHELRQGPGWLRTPRLFSDFTLSFDFQLAAPGADAAVFIRTLTAAPRRSERWGESAYRIRLPSSAAALPTDVLTAVRGNVQPITQGRVALRSPGGWQRFDITANGRRVTATLNGELVGEFEIEHFTGHVVFEVTDGAAQFRDVTITPAASHAASGVSTDTPLLRAGDEAVAAPRLLKEVKAFYTPEAMRRKAEGVVVLDAVVLPDGSVGAVQVKRELDPDLDQAAVASLRRWLFLPATRNGIPVAVAVSVEVAFTIKN